MAFLRTFSASPGASIRTPRLLLRPPQLVDYAQWSMLRAESRAFLVPWEPLWPGDDLTRAAFRHRIRRYNREAREQSSLPWFLFERTAGTLLGGVTISNIRRGVAQTASLGYWIGERHARQGYMSEAAAAIIGFCFDSLALHRIEAACLVHNAASSRLLLKLGFTEEGLARGYLQINGRWQDHRLFAILREDWSGPHPVVAGF